MNSHLLQQTQLQKEREFLQTSPLFFVWSLGTIKGVGSNKKLKIIDQIVTFSDKQNKLLNEVERMCIRVLYLVVVGSVRKEFGAHVVRCAYESAGHVILVFQNPGYAQVTHLDYICSCQKNILSFKISVQNVLFM